MLIDINNTQERYDKLIEAYSEDYRDEIKKVSTEIYNKIKKWTKTIPQFDKRQDNVFDIQTRVKGQKSFGEKLYRNNLIKTWDVTDNISENQEYIKTNLDDIIGVRINCYFVVYEKRLYDYFQQNCNQLTDFSFDFTTNTKQKNGHNIWKFKGKYKDIYNLEIQIKAVIHNVWGEVEHKTIYKNPKYDGYADKKIELAESLHDIMFASDRQLYSIFNMQETEDSLLKSLFYCYTKDEVGNKCKTEILARHYRNYFEAFKDLTEIKKFLSLKLEGSDYPKRSILEPKESVDEKLLEKVKTIFPKFYIECIYHIDSIIHNHRDGYESFLIYFIKRITTSDSPDEFDDMFKPSFDGEEDLNPNDNFEDQLNLIDEALGKCRLDKTKTENKDE